MSARKWSPAVSSLELIRHCGQAPSIPRSVWGNYRYRLWGRVGNTPFLILIYSFPIWNTFGLLLVLWDLEHKDVIHVQYWFYSTWNRINTTKEQPKNMDHSLDNTYLMNIIWHNVDSAFFVFKSWCHFYLVYAIHCNGTTFFGIKVFFYLIDLFI